ncbi:MAG: J domain-containing protein [Bacteroidetes bacterium]|nr:J domain-containing protein [Bacteroidota bacterium]
MIYFNGCTTIVELKVAYKKLAKQNHPDLGGDTATMQAINKEYAFACAHISKNSDFSDEHADSEIRLSELYREAIEKIIHLPAINIEVVGHWIWVTGNTYAARKELKEAGFYFAAKKLAWYFRSDAFKTRGGKKTLDEIRRKYGAETVNKRREAKTIDD